MYNFLESRESWILNSAYKHNSNDEQKKKK